MTRFSLALILLFIAPSAWGQPLPWNCPPGWYPGAIGSTGTLNCYPGPELPDSSKTPGVIAEDGHDEATVCAHAGDDLSYSKRHRATPEGLKAMIRKRDHAIAGGEVDHRLPLALGGADVVYNLWWQPGPESGATWTFRDKDRLEQIIWQQVCKDHSMPLATAQRIFLAPDWRVGYCALFEEKRCAEIKTPPPG